MYFTVHTQHSQGQEAKSMPSSSCLDVTWPTCNMHLVRGTGMKIHFEVSSSSSWKIHELRRVWQNRGKRSHHTQSTQSKLAVLCCTVHYVLCGGVGNARAGNPSLRFLVEKSFSLEFGVVE